MPRSSSPLFAPRLDWVIFLATVGFSLTLLFFGKGKAAAAAKQEIGGAVAYLAKPVLFVRRTFGLWQENSVLREQAVSLSQENGDLRDQALENARLRAMLGFKGRFAMPLATASVIGYPGSEVGGRILLDVGRHDGIRTNSAVLTPMGLVGKIVEVSEFASLVQTLEGNAYGVSVMIERSRVAGILRWIGPHEWTIVGLSTGEDVRVGDLVVTAGAGMVFPKNIRVGVVTKVTGQGTPNSGWCRVRPFVRFESLEEVFVAAPPSTADRGADSLMAREARP
ncbi:MAG TPA: rod shape-determining protein MreC [bacterium]|jgi:rod shape-determining protein MreC